jgi:hypothetical protein
MNVVSYGGGTNSTALLIECAKRGVKVDLILFADTGGERPNTYNYIGIFNEWLVSNGMPKITMVQAVNAQGDKITLEENMLRLGTLPSVAYGFKTCSQRFKIAPQDKFMNSWAPAQAEWAAGRKITKLIGYDAGESHRTKKDYSDEKYQFDYPLVRWGMGRDQCVQSILDAGLCLPGKSSCFFCPNSRKTEIRHLAAVYPELAERAVAMEKNANLTHIAGLGRSFAWGDLLATSDMFPDEFHYTPEMSCDCYDGEAS